MKMSNLLWLTCGVGVLTLCVSIGCSKLGSSSKPLPKTDADPGNVICNTSTVTWNSILVKDIHGYDSAVFVPFQMTICYDANQSPGGTTPTGSTPPSTIWTTANSIYTTVSGTVISDPTKAMGCYDTTKFGSVAIYVKEPGGIFSYSTGSVDVGDAWVEIIGSGMKRVFGFYPTGGLHPITSPSGPGEFIDRAGALFDYRLEFGASQHQMANIWNFVNGYMPTHMTYNFNTFNTADFAIKVAKLAEQPINASQAYFNNAGWATSAYYLGNALRYTSINTAIMTENGYADADMNVCP